MNDDKSKAKTRRREHNTKKTCEEENRGKQDR